MEVMLYPDFDRWLRSVEPAEPNVHAELIALLDALEAEGRRLAEPESHPTFSSRFDMHALRRTPPSPTIPRAFGPPVIRMLYAFCRRRTGTTIAVVLVGGEKTHLGNRWYPPNVIEAERRLLVHTGRHQLVPLRRR